MKYKYSLYLKYLFKIILFIFLRARVEVSIIINYLYSNYCAIKILVIVFGFHQ